MRSEEDGAEEEEEISRKRCSTPISSASSASIVVGTWVKVRWVAVPSYEWTDISSCHMVLAARSNDE